MPRPINKDRLDSTKVKYNPVISLRMHERLEKYVFETKTTSKDVLQDLINSCDDEKLKNCKRFCRIPVFLDIEKVEIVQHLSRQSGISMSAVSEQLIDEFLTLKGH